MESTQERDEKMVAFVISEMGLQKHFNANRISVIVDLFRSCEYEEKMLKLEEIKRKMTPNIRL